MQSRVIKPGDTTILPKRFGDLISVRYNILMTALSPIAHSATTIGNDSILMTERVADPDSGDDPVDVPCITGNSLRHSLRDALARLTLQILNIKLHSLPLAAQHFLFSGGSLGKRANTINVEEFRRLQGLFPYIGLFGGGLGSVLIAGKLQVGYGVLLCAQNAWRLSKLCPALERIDRPAEDFRERRVRTRMDSRRSVMSRHLIASDEDDKWLRQLDDEGVEIEDSTQMIYGYETICPGAKFLWQIGGRLMTPLEHSALICSVSALAAYGKIGAKTGTGCGSVSVRVISESGVSCLLQKALSSVDTPKAVLELSEELGGAYVQHVSAVRGEIVEWLVGMR